MISSYAIVVLLFLTLESVTTVPPPQPKATVHLRVWYCVPSCSAAGSGHDGCIVASLVPPLPPKLPYTNVRQRLELVRDHKVTGLGEDGERLGSLQKVWPCLDLSLVLIPPYCP